MIAAAAGGAALLSALVFVENDGFLQPILIALTAVASLAPIVVRLFQRRFDPFEPIAIVSAAFFVLFVMRPLWMWMHDEWALGIYDLRDGLSGAAAIALVGTLAVIAGYTVDFGRRIAFSLPELPDDWDPRRTAQAALLMLVGAALMFSFFIGPGGVIEYFSGRDNSFTRGLTRNVFGDSTSSAYFYLAPYTSVPLVLVMLEVWRRKRTPMYALLGIALFLLVFLMTVPRGDRTYILALALPLVVVAYVRRDRRPPLVGVVAAVVGTMMIANVLVEYRTKDERVDSLPSAITRSVTNPTASVDTFMLGADVSMMSVLSAQYTIMPDKLDYSPGQATTAALLLPVPGALWRGKPEDTQAEVFEVLFPVNASIIKAGFTSSLLGSFYGDSGFVGVFVYSFLFGILLRALFDYWRRFRGNMSVTILYGALLASLIILIRANPAAMAGLSLFLVAPIVVAFWWGARGARGAAQA